MASRSVDLSVVYKKPLYQLQRLYLYRIKWTTNDNLVGWLIWLSRGLINSAASTAEVRQCIRVVNTINNDQVRGQRVILHFCQHSRLKWS